MQLGRVHGRLISAAGLAAVVVAAAAGGAIHAAAAGSDVGIDSVTVTQSPPYVAGTAITFEVKVSDPVGAPPATNVLLSDDVPAGVSINTVTVTGNSAMGNGSCTAGVPGDAARPTTCGLGAMMPGDSRTVDINVTILPATTGTIHDDATLSAAAGDNDNSNDRGHVDVPITVSSPLSITKSGFPSTVTAGNPLDYTLVVTDSGPSTATGVSLTDALPNTLIWNSTSTSISTSTCSFQTAANRVNCSLGTIAPGRSVSVYFNTTVKSSAANGSSITNTATATSDDASHSNSPATATTSVVTSADLADTYTSDALSYGGGQTIHYSTTITNNGPSDARSVVVTVVLPPRHDGHPTDPEDEIDDGGCSLSGHTLTCPVGTLAAGKSITIKIDLDPEGVQNGPVTSTSSVTSSTSDPDTSNNSATRKVRLG